MQPKSTLQLIKEVRSRLQQETNKQVDDSRIIKHLKSCNNDIAQTFKSIESYYQYQKETLLNFHPPAQELKAIKQAYPHAFSGVDKQGRPVYIQLIGSIKVNDLFKVIEDQTLSSYFVQRMSYLYKTIFPTTTKKELLVVIDLKGQLTKIVSKKTYKIVNQIVTVGQNFYPETLYKILFVNTPMTFDSIWNSIKEQIQPTTLQKIQFLGSDYQQELHKRVDRQYLPECLGGKLSEQEFIKGRGPWVSQSEQQKQENEDEESQEENQIDFGALKAALSNIVPKQHQVRKDVASTPLNTEADDYS